MIEEIRKKLRDEATFAANQLQGCRQTADMWSDRLARCEVKLELLAELEQTHDITPKVIPTTVVPEKRTRRKKNAVATDSPVHETAQGS